ncbi:MAG: family 10 glycosylhydrolase [Bacteroidales bacterium]|nr:family 10 glycosylhydrolase [Bacteroidales bacterium]
MKHRTILLLLAALLVASCAEKPSVPLYGWDSIGKDPDLEAVRVKFREWKGHGFTGVCIQADLADIPALSAIAHEEGLEYHAWRPCILQEGKPHDWYAVNRLGQRADEFPAYVQYYRALDPANPDVQDYIVSMISDIAAVPDVDYVQLDYIRYVDAVLARGLWDKYGLDFSDGPYPPADYCYCERCVGEFKELTGIDILQVEDPEAVPEWTAFRCGKVTALVTKVYDAVHALGKKVSADVFPGPDAYAVPMVRQQWDEWPLDMVFPMNYNDFYLEPAGWLYDITAEEVKAAGDVPVISGLFICRDWQRKAEIEDPEGQGLLPSELATAVKGSLDAGAAGICLFTPGSMTPEHWAELDKLFL